MDILKGLFYINGTDAYSEYGVFLSEEEQENGLKTYGCYYVPAVNGRYLEVVPSERGFFN